jgi:hypothetical protein
MRRLADFLIAVTDLVRAEVREAGRSVYRIVQATALSVVFVLLLLFGFGFLLASLFLALEPQLGAAGASLVTGVVSLAAGAIGLVGTRWMMD